MDPSARPLSKLVFLLTCPSRACDTIYLKPTIASRIEDHLTTGCIQLTSPTLAQIMIQIHSLSFSPPLLPFGHGRLAGSLVTARICTPQFWHILKNMPIVSGCRTKMTRACTQKSRTRIGLFHLCCFAHKETNHWMIKPSSLLLCPDHMCMVP